MEAIRVKKPSVMCALGHGLYEPWLTILNQGQLKTWLAIDLPENFHIFHYHGTPVSRIAQSVDHFHEKIRWRNKYLAVLLSTLDNIILHPLNNYIPSFKESSFLPQLENAVHIRFPDTYLTYRWKLLSLLKYFIEETKFDYLFIASTASYVQPDLVLKYIQSLENTSIYAGAEPYDGAGFISGSNRIISRKIAQEILAVRKKWKPGIIEDVEFSRLVVANGNNLQTFPIVNIESMSKLLELTNEFIKGNYHFRLKSFVDGKRNDIAIMHALHQRIMLMKSET